MATQYKRRDGNHKEIKEELEKYGFSVHDAANLGDSFPDLVVAFQGITGLIEVKDGSKVPSKRKLSEGQIEFQQRWKGYIDTVINTKDCLKLRNRFFEMSNILKKHLKEK